MAPSRSAIASGSGWSSCAADARATAAAGTAFSAAESITIGLELCRAVSAVHARRPAASRHQGAERDARRRRSHRADGLRHRQGAGRRARRRIWPARRSIWRPRSWPGRRPRCRATSTASACCSITSSPASYPVRGRTIRDVREAHERGERTALRSRRGPMCAEARARHRARARSSTRATLRECRCVRRATCGRSSGDPAIARLRYGLPRAPPF